MHERDGWTGQVEDLDVAPAALLPTSPRDVLRWPVLALVAAVAAIAVLALHSGTSTPSSAGHPTAAVHTSPASPTVAASPSPARMPAPVTVVDLGHPLLGTATGWELFARTEDRLIRIQPALGRITQTQVPALASTGPVTFVVTATTALIRPVDVVPGYVVPDGQPAREMPTNVSISGPVFPGPDLGHVWQQLATADLPLMALVGPDGIPTNQTISFDLDTSPLNATPDGAGYLLVTGSGGVYDARPDGMHRITTGQVLAAGPTGWLVAECDANHRCANILRDRAGRSRAVPGAANLTPTPTGVISPDGTTAAVFTTTTTTTTTPDNIPALTLIDLATGHSRPIDLPRRPDRPVITRLVTRLPLAVRRRRHRATASRGPDHRRLARPRMGAVRRQADCHPGHTHQAVAGSALRSGSPGVGTPATPDTAVQAMITMAMPGRQRARGGLQLHLRDDREPIPSSTPTGSAGTARAFVPNAATILTLWPGFVATPARGVERCSPASRSPTAWPRSVAIFPPWLTSWPASASATPRRVTAFPTVQSIEQLLCPE